MIFLESFVQKKICSVNKMSSSETFWVKDFSQLYYNSTIIPSSNQSRDQNLNSFTRLLILVTLILLLTGSKISFLVLFVGIIIILLLYFLFKEKSEAVVEHYTCRFKINKNNSPSSIKTRLSQNSLSKVKNSRLIKRQLKFVSMK